MPTLKPAVRGHPNARNPDVERYRNPWRDEGRRDAKAIETEADPFLLARPHDGSNARFDALRQDQFALKPELAGSCQHRHDPVTGNGLRRDSGKADPADHEGHQGQPEEEEEQVGPERVRSP